jgi:catalase
VQCHFKTDQGIKNLSRQEAEKLSGSDPDYGRRVAAGLGLDIVAVERLAAMSAAERAQATEPATFI